MHCPIANPVSYTHLDVYKRQPQTITGYCLAPVALLPEETRQAVVKMVEYYYGSYAIDAWGYREFVTEEGPADAEIVVDTVALGG